MFVIGFSSAINRALLEGEVQLLEGNLDRLGAHRGRVHEELGRRREPHPEPLEVSGRPDGNIGRELAGAGVPGAEDVDAGLLLEATVSASEASLVKKLYMCALSSKTNAPSTALIGA